MLRTRNRSIKDFVSKDKEKDDGISRVLGSGTKDLKTSLVPSVHAVTLCEISA